MKNLRYLLVFVLLTLLCSTVKGQTVLFEETFNKCKGQGGNDGKFSGNLIARGDLATLSDNAGWTCSSRTYAAFGCARVGTSTKSGYIITPEISKLDGNATLTFRAAAWDANNEKTTIKLAIEGGGTLSENEVTLVKGQFSDYSIEIVGGTSSTKIRFASPEKQNRFFIDDVKVVDSKDTKAYTFDQSMQNILPEQDVENANVKIIRTLDNTDWNTFCVPFDISESKIKSVFGEGTVIKAFTSVDGTKMVFTTSADIKAGVPYLVLPGNEIVENPVFSNVTVVSGDAKAITTADNDAYTFVGVYSPTQMATDGTEAFIGSGGRLLFPNEGQNTINGMRAFIRYKNTAVRPVVEIGGDNDTAGIGGIENNGKKYSQKVYSIGGQYVGSSLTGLQRGIYIVNGKKTAIK